jgi:hypothetical protein
MLPLRKNGSDDFQTPPSAVKPLLKYIPKDMKILEPSQGKGYIVNYMKSLGYNITGKDIKNGYDFLNPNSTKDIEFDMVLTNPPYSKRYEFLKRAYEIGKPFSYLMPLTTLETEKRLSLFKKYGIELLILNKRVNFETPNNKESHAWFPVAWFCYKILPDKLVFED